MAKKKVIKPVKKNISSKTVKKTEKSSKNKFFEKFKCTNEKIHTFRKKRYFPVVFVLLILLVGLWFGRSILFAAMVGGTPITRIKLINELEKQGGQEALDTLITKELVLQEARKKGVKVTDLEINSEIQKIEEILSSQGTTLDLALSMQGQTKDDLIENIRLQKIVEGLLSDNISVTDQDVSDYYEQNKTLYGDDVNFEEVKDSLKDQLVQEKLSTEFQILIERLRSEGNIIYFLNFN